MVVNMIQIISLSSAIALCLILESSHSKVAFNIGLKSQFILLFNLFLLLFMSPTVLFDIIYGPHYTILVNRSEERRVGKECRP